MSNVVKRTKGSFRLCVCSIPYLNSTTAGAPLSLCFFFFFSCGDERRANLKVAVMFRWLKRDSAWGTACLFNLERMWIPWAKIPEHQTRWAPCLLMSGLDGQCRDSCPAHTSHFCTKVEDVGCLCSVWLMLVAFWSVCTTSTLSYGTLHLQKLLSIMCNGDAALLLSYRADICWTAEVRCDWVGLLLAGIQ